MKPIDRRVTRITSEEINSELSHWELPSVESGRAVTKNRNAFVRKVAAAPENFEPEISESDRLNSELEQIKEKARSEAFEEGYKEGAAKGLIDGLDEGQRKGQQQGYDAGFESGKADVTTLQQNLAAIIRQQEQPTADIHQNLEQQLTSMVVDLARAVVGHSAAVNPQVVKGLINEMLDQIPLPHDTLKIHVHPDSVDIVQDMITSTRQSWQVEPDAAVQPGGCFVQTINTFADNTLTTRFDQVLGQFEQYKDHANSEADA